MSFAALTLTVIGLLARWNIPSQNGISWSRVVSAAGMKSGALGSRGLMALLGIPPAMIHGLLAVVVFAGLFGLAG